LIAASPNDQVGTVHVLLLFLGRAGLDECDALLLATHDPLVEVLGVASEARKGVKVTVFFGKFVRLELVVAVFLGVRDFVIEDFDLLTVKDLNVAVLEGRELRIVKFPVIIVKETETDTETIAN
jgi:hypothetical protein